MLTMTDLFCGAGGSSTGAVMVPGVQVRLAANHWQLAVDSHNANHPDTDHLCADLSAVDPRFVPSTDLAWMSPECTNHSIAKGKRRDAGPDLFGDMLPDAAAERSRATMWDVVRFSEVHRYRAVIVENVVDVAQWLPFHAWLAAMASLGYAHRIVALNSMHAQHGGLPAPQSRDRAYIVFWRKGERAPDLERVVRPPAYCPRCDAVVDAMQTFKRPGNTLGRYRAQYVYRCPNVSCRNSIVEPAWLPASSIIDWSNPGTRIGDRARPLAEKTMIRIQAGIDRYWGPVVLEAAGNTYDAADPRHPRHGDPDGYLRVWPDTDPLRTLHTTASKAIAYPAAPLMVPVEGREGKDARPSDEVLRTMTTRSETALAYLEPLIAELRGGGSTARPTGDPLATVTAGGSHHALVVPYYGAGRSSEASRALPTVTTVEKHALIMRNNNSPGGDAAMSTPTSEVARTMTTSGHQSLLTAESTPVSIEDVYFRMLEPSEITAAMAFPGEYVVFGNRREQVRQAGNAVTPPAARDLVSAVVDAIESR